MVDPSDPPRSAKDHQLSIWATAARSEASSSTLEHTSVRFEKDDLAVLREMAEANDIPLATLVRNIVHAWIVEEGHRPSRPVSSTEELAERIASLVLERLEGDCTNPSRP